MMLHALLEEPVKVTLKSIQIPRNTTPLKATPKLKTDQERQETALPKAKIQLFYLFLKLDGVTFRILYTNQKSEVRGDPSSDFLSFFGLSSGESQTRIPEQVYGKFFRKEKFVTNTELLVAQTFADFVGFIDEGKNRYLIFTQDSGLNWEQLINWPTYSQLGIPSHAYAIMGAMERYWCAYPSEELYKRRIEYIRKLITLM